MKKMEIVIISGFLGSGKTSLIANIINEQKDKKIAILMNELGGFNVDSKILGTDTPYSEILNGCICCDLKSDVEVQLNDLYYKHHPDMVIIEATGVAHPIEIYDACTAPSLLKFATVNQIATIVDPIRFLNRDQYSNTTKRLMEEQIQYANTLILNKMDLMDSVQYDVLKKALDEINDKAKRIETTYGKVDASFLNITAQLEKSHQHHHHGIQSMVYTFNGAIDARQFVNWLMKLENSVLRVKGYIKFRENPEQTVLFQYAYGIPQYEEEMMNYPLKLVVIGEQLDKNKLMNQLDQLQFS